MNKFHTWKRLCLMVVLALTAGRSAVAASGADFEAAFTGIVPQSRDGSCGAAALASVMRYWLGDTDVTETTILEELARRGHMQGATLSALSSVATARGYAVSLPRVRANDLQKLRRPVLALIHRSGAAPHFVIIKSVRDGQVQMADPSLGHVFESVNVFVGQWANADGVGRLLVVDRVDSRRLADSPLGASHTARLSASAMSSVVEALSRRQGELSEGKYRISADWSLVSSSRTYAPEGIHVRTLDRSLLWTFEYSPTSAHALVLMLPLMRSALSVTGASDSIRLTTNARGPMTIGWSARQEWDGFVTQATPMLLLPAGSSESPQAGGHLALRRAVPGGTVIGGELEVMHRFDPRAGDSRLLLQISLQGTHLLGESLSVSGSIAVRIDGIPRSRSVVAAVGFTKALSQEIAIRGGASVAAGTDLARGLNLGIVYTPR